MSDGPRIITMTAYRRPDYTRQVLAALAQCEGIGDFVFMPCIEPTHEDVIAAFDGWDACEIQKFVQPNRKGLNRNTYVAMSRAKEVNASLVVHVEDDTVFSSDALRYFRWACEKIMPTDGAIVFASGYNKPLRQPAKDQRFLCGTRQVWTPWGWAVNADRLKWLLAKWRFGNPKCFTCPFKKRFAATRLEIYPYLSRVQNIGYEMGENNRTPQWYKENHSTPWVAAELPGKPYRLDGKPPAGRVKRYVGAIAKWRQAGKPVRSDEEVLRIYTEVCEPCEHFNDKTSACRVCGCKIRKSGSAFRSKLKMATEYCPKGKWGIEKPKEPVNVESLPEGSSSGA